MALWAGQQLPGQEGECLARLGAGATAGWCCIGGDVCEQCSWWRLSAGSRQLGAAVHLCTKCNCPATFRRSLGQAGQPRRVALPPPPNAPPVPRLALPATLTA